MAFQYVLNVEIGRESMRKLSFIKVGLVSLLVLVSLVFVFSSGIGISANTDIVTFTKNTEKICNDDNCVLASYSGSDVFVDDEGTRIEEAKSLVGIWEMHIDEDPNFPVEVVDFNYDSITLDLEVSDKHLSKDIDLKVKNKYNKSRGPLDSSKKPIDKDKKIKIKKSNEKYRTTIDLSDSVESLLDQKIKWGTNSTTITFSPGAINGTDTMIINKTDAPPQNSTNYGTGGSLYIGSGDDGAYRTLMNFNFTCDTTYDAFKYNWVKLQLYVGAGYGSPVYVYPMNHTWNETNETWVSCGVGENCTGWFNQSQNISISPVTTPTGAGTGYINISLNTTWFTEECNSDSDKRYGFIILGEEFGDDNFVIFRSSDHGTASKRPVLFINYSSAVIINTTSGYKNWIKRIRSSFNNSLAIENFTFTGTQSYIRYITMSNNDNLTNGSLIVINQTGSDNYTYNLTIDIGNDGDVEFSSVGAYGNNGTMNSTNTTLDFISELNDYLQKQFLSDTDDSYLEYHVIEKEAESSYRAVDNDWTTGVPYIARQPFVGAGPFEVYINHTLDYPFDIVNITVEFRVKSTGTFLKPTISAYCHNGSDWGILWSDSDFGTSNFTVSANQSCFEGKSKLQMRYSKTDDMTGGIFYEDFVTLYSSCEDSNGNCQVPINITSTNGKVQIHTIDIPFKYNISHLFNINETYNWNKTKNVIPNEKQKRRYSLKPTSDLSSNDIAISGYYLRNGTADECEINNEPQTVTSNYCVYTETVNLSDTFPNHKIWDSNITEEISVNLSLTNFTVGDTHYQNMTIVYRDADNVSTASAGLFKNVTHCWTYNSSVTEHETLQWYNSSGGNFVDITPSSKQGCPNYEQKLAGTKVFYTCINRTQRYACVIIEEND